MYREDSGIFSLVIKCFSITKTSPTVKSGHRAQLRPITKWRLRVISVNFQSMKAKRESFWST